MIVIVDYEMGNVRSIQHKLRKWEKDVRVSSDPNVIDQAEKIILPGVGHFAQGMKNIARLGLADILNKKVTKDRIPFLGICVGMQLLTSLSEEGGTQGLGWIEASTEKFSFDRRKELRIPHVAWNTIQVQSESPLLEGLQTGSRFYFTHSYYVQAPKAEVASTVYGHRFSSVIHSENIFGTQFHPEKSHGAGRRLLQNFIGNC